MFNRALHEFKWDDVLNMDDPQKAYTEFHNKYTRLFNDCFPIKRIKKGYKNRKPWLSDSLKKRIKVKNQLYRRYKRAFKDTDREKYALIYKKFRNQLNGLLRKAEKEHYDLLLNENKNNDKTLGVF